LKVTTNKFFFAKKKEGRRKKNTFRPKASQIKQTTEVHEEIINLSYEQVIVNYHEVRTLMLAVHSQYWFVSLSPVAVELNCFESPEASLNIHHDSAVLWAEVGRISEQFSF